MSDRFKFRVYIPDENRYMDNRVDNPIINGDGEAMWSYLNPFGHWEHHSMEEVVVEQCTGLVDKNGKLIYEGDVIQENGINKYIYWNVTCWAYSMRKGHKNVAWELRKEDAENGEIIGNIHEEQFREVTKMVEGEQC